MAKVNGSGVWDYISCESSSGRRCNIGCNRLANSSGTCIVSCAILINNDDVYFYVNSIWVRWGSLQD
ncbi:hypothetical protein [Sphaerospermopsis aphanizomenoides]|uniref:hypothetical protein n=1 Tax=Sphaerospermopsis aphanizomenoides TaxID=459663 RepID=UPI002AD220A5|nr:hypothetical protein [Sphaerospermopsis aphanizomenoides]